MKYLFTTGLLIVLLSACKSGRSNRSEIRKSKEIYVYAFKMTYFRSMLIAGFRNSPEINKIILEDKSGYGEPVLSMEDYRFIDSLVAVDKARLIADSAASIGRVAEGSEGKKVFIRTIERYNSHWLTKEAKKRFKPVVIEY